jgi:hypothetical protein
VSENRLLRRTFGAKRDSIRGLLRKLYIMMCRILRTPGQILLRFANKFEIDYMGGTFSIHAKQEKCKQVFGTKTLKMINERTKRRWEDDIEMGLKKIRFKGLDWFILDQYRIQWRAVVNTRMNLLVP